MQVRREDAVTQKKWTGSAAIIITIVIAIVISVGYAQFATRQIRQESESYLMEIYTQINKTFYTTITKNWKLLHGWRNHISEKAATAPEEFADFIQTLKDDWRFTTFYFFSEDGEYMTALGDRGYLDLGENLERLVEDREDIVVDGTLPSTKQLTVFAVPIQPGQYNGFQYTAIGISFNREDMTGALSISAFDGQSDCYITYPDGRILFSSHSRENQPYNLLAYIREHGNLTDGGDAAGVARDWKEGTARSAIWEFEGTSYYLCYQPVNFSGWMLVSIAPTGVVNASMNRFTMVTLAVIGLIFLTVGICGVSFVMAGSRRRMWEKNQEIESREMLFDLLTHNTEDIFILFTPEDFAAGYVSPNMERVLGIRLEDIRGDVRPLLFGTGEGSLEEGQSLLTPEILAGIPMGNLWPGSGRLPTSGPTIRDGSSSCSTTALCRGRNSLSSCFPTARRRGR